MKQVKDSCDVEWGKLESALIFSCKIASDVLSTEIALKVNYEKTPKVNKYKQSELPYSTQMFAVIRELLQNRIRPITSQHY